MIRGYEIMLVMVYVARRLQLDIFYTAYLKLKLCVTNKSVHRFLTK